MIPATPQSIPVDRIFLDRKNPRHKPYASDAEVIDYLCTSEQIYTLAKDMVTVGLNPLELFALVPIEPKSKQNSQSLFTVVEGNRRMCAIKLLHDPDLAPANLRKDFRTLAKSSRALSEVLGVVFKDDKEASPWLERIHGGPQNGIGRKPWNAEQKTRHLGDQKNVLAQDVLDYAERQKFISAEERKGKLTTAQRYLGNAVLRETIGLDSTNSKDLSRTRPSEDFDILLKTFVRDLIAGTVHSRSNAEDITKYSRSLSEIEGLSGKRIPAASLNTSVSSRKVTRTPKEPKKPKSIGYEEEIMKALKRTGNYKLEKLYFSLCEITLDKHTPLISVGVWSFLETLTAKCGRISTAAFPDFLNANKLTALGFAQRDQRSAISQTLSRISSYGNTTKHHDTAANFNGEQIANDMAMLKDLILKLAAEVKP